MEDRVSLVVPLPLEVEGKREKSHFFSDYASIIYSLLCAILFAIHNYLMAYCMRRWRNSVTVLYPEFLSFMLPAILYHTAYLPLVEKRPVLSGITGVYLKDGHVNRHALVALVLRGVNSCVLPVSFALLTYFCNEVGMLPAVA